jgi:hypothetical protein
MPTDFDLSQLTEATAWSDDDLLYIMRDISTTPVDRKIKPSTLKKVLRYASSRYVITPSVSSNNLTVAIKDMSGNDPSASNPLLFRVGNTDYSLEAATSVTKNAGTNWCNAGSSELKTLEVDYFVYAIGETGASAGLKFGFSRIPYATTMNDFVNTAANEKYIAGNWTNFNATDAVVNIGRFNAINSGSASYNWSIPATSVIINYPITETRWLNWLPTWANLTVGNATQVAIYKIAYDRLSVKLDLVWGNSTSIAGTVTSTLPFTVTNTATAAAFPLGICNLLDSGTASYYGSVDTNGTGGTSIRIRCINASGTYATLVAINATTPHTWATSDEIDYNLPSLPIR